MKTINYITPLLMLSLMACQTTNRPDPKDSKSAINESLVQAQAPKAVTPPPAMMPADVQRELNSQNSMGAGMPPLPAERRFDVSAHNVDARVFFPSLVEGTPLSVAVHPEVQGTISLSLKTVTLGEVIQVVEDIYAYEVSR